jgi:hypothetical protein
MAQGTRRRGKYCLLRSFLFCLEPYALRLMPFYHTFTTGKRWNIPKHLEKGNGLTLQTCLTQGIGTDNGA